MPGLNGRVGNIVSDAPIVWRQVKHLAVHGTEYLPCRKNALICLNRGTCKQRRQSEKLRNPCKNRNTCSPCRITQNDTSEVCECRSFGSKREAGAIRQRPTTKTVARFLFKSNAFKLKSNIRPVNAARFSLLRSFAFIYQMEEFLNPKIFLMGKFESSEG